MSKRAVIVSIVVLSLIAIGCGLLVGMRSKSFFVRNNVGWYFNELAYLMSSSRFISSGSLLEDNYQIFNFRTPFSSNDEEIVFFNDFRSPEISRSTFESNTTTPYAKLIERGDLLDACGKKVGERGIVIFVDKDHSATRIFWIYKDVFWAIQAPTEKLAMEFEQDEFVQRKAKPVNCFDQ